VSFWGSPLLKVSSTTPIPRKESLQANSLDGCPNGFGSRLSTTLHTHPPPIVGTFEYQYKLDASHFTKCSEGDFENAPTVPLVCVDTETNEIDQSGSQCEPPAPAPVALNPAMCYGSVESCDSTYPIGDEAYDFDHPQCTHYAPDDGGLANCPLEPLTIEDQLTYRIYLSGVVRLPEKECLVWSGSVIPEPDDCKSERSGGLCAFKASPSEPVTYTYRGSVHDGSGEGCNEVRVKTVYSYDGRENCQTGLDWEASCPIHYTDVENPADYFETPISAVCKFQGELVASSFCEVNKGAAPQGTCSASDIASDDFVNDLNEALCPSLFPDAAQLTVSSVERCLVKHPVSEKTLYIDVAQAAGTGCSSTTFGSCLDRIAVPKSGEECYGPITVKGKLKGADEVYADQLDMPQEPSDYRYANPGYPVSCDATNLVLTNCDGKYNADLGGFEDLYTCGYKTESNEVKSANPAFCTQNMPSAPAAEPCTLRKLTVSGARKSLCTDLFPKSDDQDFTPAGADPADEKCYALAVTGIWVPLSVAPEELPDVCANLKTGVLPTECAELEAEDGTCTKINLDSAKCKVKDGSYYFDMLAPCQEEYDTQRIARSKKDCSPGTYVTQLADSFCNYNSQNNGFEAGSGRSYACKYKADESDPGSDADPEFCSLTKDDEEPFTDLVDTYVNKPCDVKDLVEWSSACSDIFHSGLSNIQVRSETFPGVCVVNADNGRVTVDDAICTDNALPKPEDLEGKFISDCEVKFVEPADGEVTFDCKVAPDLTQTSAKCTVENIPMVIPSGLADLTLCEEDYRAYVYNPPSCNGVYSYEYYCSHDYVTNPANFPLGELVPRCKYAGEDAEMAYCEVHLQPPLDQACTISHLSPSLFVPNPRCSELFDAQDEPDAAYCLLKSQNTGVTDTVRISATGAGAGNAGCLAHAKTLDQCISRRVKPNPAGPCLLAPTVECVLSGSSDPEITYDLERCGGALDTADYHFTDNDYPCTADSLSSSADACVGRFSATLRSMEPGSSTCLYNNQLAHINFCLANGLSEAKSCRVADLPLAGARTTICSLLYPPNPETSSPNKEVLSNEDVPDQCFVLSTDGEWVPLTSEELVSPDMQPPQCAALSASTIENCLVLSAPSSTCITTGLEDATAKCIVSGTEDDPVRFTSQAYCQTVIIIERRERAKPTQECLDGGSYELRIVDTSQCSATLSAEPAPIEEGELSRKTVSSLSSANGKCFYVTSDVNGQLSSAPATIDFCAADKIDFNDVEDASIILTQCTLLDAGLKWETGVCGVEQDKLVKIPYTACVIRTSAGEEEEEYSQVSTVLCLNELNERDKYACSSTPVQWLDRAPEASCFGEGDTIEEEEVTVATNSTCAIRLPDGTWYAMSEEESDANADQAYWHKCRTEHGEYPATKTTQPGSCVASAYWTWYCDGDKNRVSICGGTADENTCANTFGPPPSYLPPKCPEYAEDKYEWYAVLSGCDQNDCGLGEVAWYCKATSYLRASLSPLDPLALRFNYTDQRLADPYFTWDGDDDACLRYAPKPNFTHLPCPCPGTQPAPSSTAPLVYPGEISPLVLDETSGLWLRQPPQCEGENCPVVETVVPAGSIISRVHRTKSKHIDFSTCDPDTLRMKAIDGDATDSVPCMPPNSEAIWIHRRYYWNDESECTAPCNVPGLSKTKFAFACVRVVVSSGGYYETMVVKDEECLNAGKPRPSQFECNLHKCVKPYVWVVGQWTTEQPMTIDEMIACESVSLVRQVGCYSTTEGQGEPEKVDDSLCLDAKPETTRTLSFHSQPYWKESAPTPCTWGQSGGFATRRVDCVYSLDEVGTVKVADSLCTAPKPATTLSCCVNGGTIKNGACVCPPGFHGKACELGGIPTVHVPSYQHYDSFMYSIPEALPDELPPKANFDLISASDGKLLSRLLSDVPVSITGVLSFTPRAGQDAFGRRFKLRITPINSPPFESNVFILNRKKLCDNEGEYMDGSCKCKVGGVFAGTFCQTDVCDACENEECAINEDGDVTNCCNNVNTFNTVLNKCAAVCSAKTCANHGVAVLNPQDECVCSCPIGTSWDPEQDCRVCTMSCGAKGRPDAQCAECVCDRGVTSENGTCNCRSLVVRLALARTSTLDEAERAAISADISVILTAKVQSVPADRIIVTAGAVRSGRVPIDITIKPLACQPEAAATMLSKLNPTSWFKTLDDFSVEFDALGSAIYDALSEPDTLPSSLSEYDASLGASITDPACDPEFESCVEPKALGNGGPALNDDEDDSGGNDDLKWIIPVAVVVPLAVIVAVAIAYVKCVPKTRVVQHNPHHHIQMSTR